MREAGGSNTSIPRQNSTTAAHHRPKLHLSLPTKWQARADELECGDNL